MLYSFVCTIPWYSVQQWPVTWWSHGDWNTEVTSSWSRSYPLYLYITLIARLLQSRHSYIVGQEDRVRPGTYRGGGTLHKDISKHVECSQRYIYKSINPSAARLNCADSSRYDNKVNYHPTSTDSRVTESTRINSYILYEALESWVLDILVLSSWTRPFFWFLTHHSKHLNKGG